MIGHSCNSYTSVTGISPAAWIGPLALEVSASIDLSLQAMLNFVLLFKEFSRLIKYDLVADKTIGNLP